MNFKIGDKVKCWMIAPPNIGTVIDTLNHHIQVKWESDGDISWYANSLFEKITPKRIKKYII